MKKHRIYTMSFAGVYPHYIAKAEKKGRTKKEVDEVIRWLTGYSQKELEALLERRTDIETFITLNFFGFGSKRSPSPPLPSICGLFTPRR